jgi:hypothetical protein
MPRPRKRASNAHTKARIWEFAGRSWPEIQEKLHAESIQDASKDDLASALLWLAGQLPGPVVKSVIESYIAAERDAIGSPYAERE